MDPNRESFWSANASECANEQGKFWEYHDKLVAEAPGGRSSFTKANLKKYAADLKLDAAKFNQCVDTDKYASVIQADIAEATRLGLRGTPSFIVNGSLLQVNTLDFSEFARTFDVLLK